MSEHADFRILIVDDQPDNIRIAAAILKSPSITISVATSGPEALERLEHLEIDLFLLDIMMPGMDGYELCRMIKEKPHYKTVPVIFLTAKTDKPSLVEAFRAGAVDYITKPFFSEELKHRVWSHLQLRQAQRELERYSNELNLQVLKAMQAEDELKQKQQELEAANKTLGELASTDPLTGMLNRRKGWDYLEYEAERCAREQRCIGILLLDIDHFKIINDTLGHEQGDEVLIHLADTMRTTMRKQDILIRWGGEEFLIALPETDIEGTEAAADKLQAAIAATRWTTGDGRLTASIGATVKTVNESWNATIGRADRALYAAKESGRNRTRTVSPEEHTAPA